MSSQLCTPCINSPEHTLGDFEYILMLLVWHSKVLSSKACDPHQMVNHDSIMNERKRVDLVKRKLHGSTTCRLMMGWRASKLRVLSPWSAAVSKYSCQKQGFKVWHLCSAL